MRALILLASSAISLAALIYPLHALAVWLGLAVGTVVVVRVMDWRARVRLPRARARWVN
jgi:hypothetical protein